MYNGHFFLTCTAGDYDIQAEVHVYLDGIMHHVTPFVEIISVNDIARKDLTQAFIERMSLHDDVMAAAREGIEERRLNKPQRRE